MLTVKTCVNRHELSDDGTPESVDNAIRGCKLAINNLACQHCSEKYFGDESALLLAMNQLKEVKNLRKRKILLFELTILRDIGELMDRLRAYDSTGHRRHIDGMDHKYRTSMSFFRTVKKDLNGDMVERIGALFQKVKDFITLSLKSIKKKEVFRLDEFRSIKEERDELLREWLEKLQEHS